MGGALQMEGLSLTRAHDFWDPARVPLTSSALRSKIHIRSTRKGFWDWKGCILTNVGPGAFPLYVWIYIYLDIFGDYIFGFVHYCLFRAAPAAYGSSQPTGPTPQPQQSQI